MKTVEVAISNKQETLYLDLERKEPTQQAYELLSRLGLQYRGYLERAGGLVLRAATNDDTWQRPGWFARRKLAREGVRAIVEKECLAGYVDNKLGIISPAIEL